MRHAALAILLVACADKPGAPPKEAPLPEKLEDLIGNAAPPFSLPSARDATTIAVPSKDVTVVTFFGTWSMGWQMALPALEALQKKHPGLRVVAVAMDEESPKEVAERYAPLPIAWCAMGTRINAQWLSGPYGGENQVFVLDRTGRIRFAHRGGKEHTVFRDPGGPEMVEEEITKLLAEP
jgi:hypothetical protein